MDLVDQAAEKEQIEVERTRKQIARYPGMNGSAPKQVDFDFVQSTFEYPIRRNEGSSGEFKIIKKVHIPGEILTVVSTRNWIMTGYKPLRIKLDRPRIVHCLVQKENQLLMSDTPQEMFLQYDAYVGAKGRVLVGGLGLGMYANMIAKKEEVTEVVVIELEQDVINISQPNHEKIKVIKGDFWKFMRESNEEFDFIYCDIYYTTGATEYITTVLPLKKIANERFPGVPIMFWAETEMASQYTEEYHKMLTEGE